MNALHRAGSREHELAIAEAIARKRVEAFGDREVIEYEDGPHYEEITKSIKTETKDWPKAPRSGSRFVGCYCTVCPKLVVNLVFGQQDSLFLDEINWAAIKEKVYYGPLKHTRYGDFTFEDIALKIQNIRFDRDSATSSNEQHNGSEMAVINNKQPIRIGYVAEKVLGKAHIKVKGFVNNEDEVIEAELTKGTPSVKIQITLCKFRGKILFDGSVTLSEKIFPDGTSSPVENGATFNIHDVIGNKKVWWVNFPLAINVPFTNA